MSETYILAIDPGPVESGWVSLDSAGKLCGFGVDYNHAIRNGMHNADAIATTLVIEMVASYGMPVGADVFETCVQIGRFEQVWPGNVARVFRREVKLHLCNSSKAKDSNVRHALMDRYGPGKDRAVGGTKCKACHGKKWRGREHRPCEVCDATGWKYPPGPLHGFADDAWQALAVGLTYLDQAKT